MLLVEKVAKQVQISSFIETIPEGYQSFVGETAIRLSGGQRPRIGIARALYKNASVLVFDEAASASDYETEQSVMDSIECLSSYIKIVVVLSISTCCDRTIK